MANNSLPRACLLMLLQMHLVRSHDVSLQILDIEERIIFQKTIYLLQRLGMDMGYRFRWYIYGPYSTELADDQFAAAQDSQLRDLADKYYLVDNAKKIIEKYIQIMGEKITDSNWLQLVASADFIMRTLNGESNKEIEEELIRRKPRYRDRKSDLTKAIRLINKNFP